MASLTWGTGHWGVDSWGTASNVLLIAASGNMAASGNLTLSPVQVTAFTLAAAGASSSSGASALSIVPGSGLTLVANGASSSAGSGRFQPATLIAQGNASSAGSGAVTNPSAADTTPPSIPTGLVAVATGSDEIVLSWVASTDNVAVKGYAIYRGGTLLDSVDRPGYVDFGVLPSRTYSYTVDAVDSSGNRSSQSGSASATTAAVATSAGGWQRLARISTPFN